MRKHFRFFFVSLGVVLVVAVIVAVIVLRPYYRMPPESVEELQAALDEYQSLAAAIADLPRHDRLEFDEMLGKMALMLRLRFDWSAAECPPKDIRQWKKHEKKLLAVSGFDGKLDRILDGGLQLQRDNALDADLVNVQAVGTWFDLQALTVVNQAENQYTDAAVVRLDKLVGVITGFYDARVLLYLALGARLEFVWNKALLFSLPWLSDEQLRKLDEVIQALPNPTMCLGDALKLEIAGFSEMFKKEGFTLDGKTSARPRLSTKIGYLKREKWMAVSLYRRQIKAVEAWAENGAVGSAPFVIEEDLEYSPLTRLVFPNLKGVDRNLRRAVAQRKAVRQVIAGELAYRTRAAVRPAEIKAGGFGRIVFENGHYCLLD